MRHAPSSEVLARAARGDVDAQTEMLRRLFGAATQPGPVTSDSLVVIEIWTRMLATHGRSEDKMRLGGFLMYKASVMQFDGKGDAALPVIEEAEKLLCEASEQGYETAETQRQELSRRLNMKVGIPAEVMLGDLAPCMH